MKMFLVFFMFIYNFHIAMVVFLTHEDFIVTTGTLKNVLLVIPAIFPSEVLVKLPFDPAKSTDALPWIKEAA